MRRPSGDDYNAYINWVLYAIAGGLNVADNMMGRYGASIRRVARYLQQTEPPELRKLYRGVLLEPGHFQSGELAPDPDRTFASFSEKRNVACWFADRTSYISMPLFMMSGGAAKGGIVSCVPTLGSILWHYDWEDIDIGRNRVVPLGMAGHSHPDLPGDQIEWAMETQFEVILKPPKRPLPLDPITDDNCPSTEELDELFTPPWIERERDD